MPLTTEDLERIRAVVRDELNKQRPSYVQALLAGAVDGREPDPTTVKKALRLSADHAREARDGQH